jgi:3-methyladenine DNA glycosylase AlkD
MPNLAANEFTARLSALRSDHKDVDFRGVKMGEIFKLGKEFAAMPVAEVELLMESPIQKVRVGALSIMGQCAKGKKCTPERLAELYSLYIRRHDRINDWGLVDLAAYYVVGQYLADRPHDILYKLANSADPWERRTAIVATAHFILKLKQVKDTFAIAEILVNDPEKFVQTGTGWMLRTAGDVDRPALLAFLNKHAATMPRVTLRYSIEKLDKPMRDYYLSLKAK